MADRHGFIIIDDDAAIRYGLRKLVEALGGEVVGEADNGLQGIEQAESLHPELILLDVSMPVMGGFTTARKLRMLQPEVKIILISQYSEPAYAEEALQIGVQAYVLKRSAGRELESAVEAVRSGQTFVSPVVRAKKNRTNNV
jgi:DNA-binding NarL/FixJ family response regulator